MLMYRTGTQEPGDKIPYDTGLQKNIVILLSVSAATYHLEGSYSMRWFAKGKFDGKTFSNNPCVVHDTM